MANMYASLHEYKLYRGIAATETDDDALLTALLRTATRSIETHCHRVFKAETDTRYYESDALDNDGQTLHVDRDLLTITELLNGDSDETEIESTEYWLVHRNYGPPYRGIRLKSTSTTNWEFDTDYWVNVTGTWGYSTTPPDDIKQACLRWCNYLYDQKDAAIYDVTVFPESGIITTPQGMPADVRLLLQSYRKRV